MRREKQIGLLWDILESARQIQRYLAGVTREAFLADTQLQDAVLRRLEIIGEAASQLPPSAHELFPDQPFRGMRGMRNIIAHDYGVVDVDQVWRTATTNVAPIAEKLHEYFRRLGHLTDG